MILIIGGAYQGKLEFARQLKGTDVTVSDGRTISLDLVPMSAEDREYRELVGHTGQLLARQAEVVYRVVCGIGTRIK